MYSGNTNEYTPAKFTHSNYSPASPTKSNGKPRSKSKTKNNSSKMNNTYLSTQGNKTSKEVEAMCNIKEFQKQVKVQIPIVYSNMKVFNFSSVFSDKKRSSTPQNKYYVENNTNGLSLNNSTNYNNHNDIDLKGAYKNSINRSAIIQGNKKDNNPKLKNDISDFLNNPDLYSAQIDLIDEDDHKHNKNSKTNSFISGLQGGNSKITNLKTIKKTTKEDKLVKELNKDLKKKTTHGISVDKTAEKRDKVTTISGHSSNKSHSLTKPEKLNKDVNKDVNRQSRPDISNEKQEKIKGVTSKEHNKNQKDSSQIHKINTTSKTKSESNSNSNLRTNAIQQHSRVDSLIESNFWLGCINI